MMISLGTTVRLIDDARAAGTVVAFVPAGADPKLVLRDRVRHLTAVRHEMKGRLQVVSWLVQVKKPTAQGGDMVRQITYLDIIH